MSHRFVVPSNLPTAGNPRPVTLVKPGPGSAGVSMHTGADMMGNPELRIGVRGEKPEQRVHQAPSMLKG